MTTEASWIKSLGQYTDAYYDSLLGATNNYARRVIAAFKISDDLGRRSIESWSMSVESECINDVMHAITSAYMSGKTQANRTLPPTIPPSVVFRTDDMDNVNRLRDFNSEEISKTANDFRILVRLRTMERQPISSVLANITEDLSAVKPKVDRLANTEILRAANEGRIREYLYRGIVEVKWIVGAGCTKCDHLKDEVMFVSQMPPLPHHPNCKCTVQATR
jgi:hypothetical protein